MKLKGLFEKEKIKVIEGNVDLGPDTTRLDYKGIIVKGEFNCSDSRITSLEGAPSHVSGNFNCYSTAITSLKGSPIWVGGFYCYYTKITSLEGSPRHVVEDFSCADTPITSLEGAPDSVGGDFYCYDTNITSLHNVHKYIKYIGGKLALPNKMQSNIMGVMFIKGLQGIEIPGFSPAISAELKLVVDIINKHLRGDRNMHDCQEELLEAGLGEYAKL